MTKNDNDTTTNQDTGLKPLSEDGDNKTAASTGLVEIKHETQVLLQHLASSQRHGDSSVDNESSNRTNRTNSQSHHYKKWRERYSLDLEVFVQQFPKVELHVHLDGTFDPDVMWNYIQQHKPASLECLPTNTLLPWEEDESRKHLPVRNLVSNCRSRQDYHDLCTCRGGRRTRSLKEMLTCFEIFLPTVRQNLPFLEQLAYDFCQRQWQQNSVYTEVRYSPYFLAEDLNQLSNHDDENKKSGSNREIVTVTGEDVYLCITRGLRRGCRDFDIVVNQILCCITWRPDWAEPTLALVQKYQNDYPCAAVGIDIAAGEEHFDGDQFPDLHQTHYNVLQKAQEAHIPITLHAGEVRHPSKANAAADNIRRSVREYGATRIGHGYHIVSNPELMEEMKQAGIHFEVCPTSSLETGAWEYGRMPPSTSNISSSGRPQPLGSKDWTRHPCRKMQSYGLSVSLNSDDPAVFHTSLAWQYRTALVKMGMSPQELVQTNVDAIHAAFCHDEGTKERIQQQINDFWQQAQHYLVETVPKTLADHTTMEHDDADDDDDVDDAVLSSLHRGQTVVNDDLRSSNNNYSKAHSADELLASSSGSTTQGTAPLLSFSARRKPPFYRRSISENFKDRVYLQTNAALVGGVVSSSNHSNQPPPTTTATTNPTLDATKEDPSEEDVIRFYT